MYTVRYALNMITNDGKKEEKVSGTNNKIIIIIIIKEWRNNKNKIRYVEYVQHENVRWKDRTIKLMNHLIYRNVP